jgi:hypothetical protein
MRAPAVVLLLLSSCASCPDPAEEASSVTLGTGIDVFVEVADGDVLTAVSGGQGGQHVWGAIRTTGLHPGGPNQITNEPAVNAPLVGFRLEDADGLYASSGPSRQRLTPDTGELLGQTVSLDVGSWSTPWLYPDDFDALDYEAQEEANEAAAADLESRTLALKVVVIDSCETEAAAEVAVQVTGVEIY